MIDFTRILPVIIEAASFISAFAAIAAGIIMAKFLRKFVTGILATGFRTIGIGIFILALGIIIDTVYIYIHALNNPASLSLILVIRQICFVIGTYVIVIGSKIMGDKLRVLAKNKPA